MAATTPLLNQSYFPKQCEELQDLLIRTGASSVTARGFIGLCPALVAYLDHCPADHEDHTGHSHNHQSKRDFTTGERKRRKKFIHNS